MVAEGHHNFSLPCNIVLCFESISVPLSGTVGSLYLSRSNEPVHAVYLANPYFVIILRWVPQNARQTSTQLSVIKLGNSMCEPCSRLLGLIVSVNMECLLLSRGPSICTITGRMLESRSSYRSCQQGRTVIALSTGQNTMPVIDRCSWGWAVELPRVSRSTFRRT